MAKWAKKLKYRDHEVLDFFLWCFLNSDIKTSELIINECNAWEKLVQVKHNRWFKQNNLWTKYSNKFKICFIITNMIFDWLCNIKLPDLIKFISLNEKAKISPDSFYGLDDYWFNQYARDFKESKRKTKYGVWTNDEIDIALEEIKLNKWFRWRNPIILTSIFHNLQLEDWRNYININYDFTTKKNIKIKANKILFWFLESEIDINLLANKLTWSYHIVDYRSISHLYPELSISKINSGSFSTVIQNFKNNTQFDALLEKTWDIIKSSYKKWDSNRNVTKRMKLVLEDWEKDSFSKQIKQMSMKYL